MSKFFEGCTVVCNNNNSYPTLELGKLYTVIRHDEHLDYLYLEEIPGGWRGRRFDLVLGTPDDMCRVLGAFIKYVLAEQPLKIGDRVALTRADGGHTFHRGFAHWKIVAEHNNSFTEYWILQRMSADDTPIADPFVTRKTNVCRGRR